MSLTEVPVTDAAIAYVLRNLWPRGVTELELLGLSDPFRYFRDCATHGHRSGVLEHEGTPVLVSGIAADADGAFTWFQATTEFDKHAAEITRRLRREAKAYPASLSIYSVCVHPDTERWFRVLGFSRSSYTRVLLSKATLYRFDRR
jgi:hypothetical protein